MMMMNNNEQSSSAAEVESTRNLSIQPEQPMAPGSNLDNVDSVNNPTSDSSKDGPTTTSTICSSIANHLSSEGSSSNHIVCNQINDLHTLFDDAILSYDRPSLPRTFGQKTSAIFTLLNYNYLCDDQLLQQHQHTQTKDHSSPIVIGQILACKHGNNVFKLRHFTARITKETTTTTSIIYRSINCLIHQPIGLIVGPVSATNKFQANDSIDCNNNNSNGLSHLYSDIVMLNYNSANCLQQTHWQQLTLQRRPKFKFIIDKGCGILFAGQILQMSYGLDERATLFVALSKVRVKSGAGAGGLDTYDEMVIDLNNSSTTETIVQVKQGTIRLNFDSDSSFSIVTSGDDNAVFSIQAFNRCVTFGPNETGFGIASKQSDQISINSEINRWKKLTSSPLLVPQQLQLCRDPDIETELDKKSKSKSKNSLGPSLIRMRSLPQVYSNSNFKYQSLLNSSYQYYSSPTSQDRTTQDLSKKVTSGPQIYTTDNNNVHSKSSRKDNRIGTTSRPVTRRSAYRPSESTFSSIKTNKQVGIDNPANNNNNARTTQQHNEKKKKGLVINIKYKEDSGDRQRSQNNNNSNSNNGNHDVKSNRSQRVHNYSAMKDIIKSSTSMIIVNKVPISFLNNYQASRRSMEAGFGLNSSENIPNSHVSNTKPKPNKLSAKSYTPFNNGNTNNSIKSLQNNQTSQRAVYSKKAKRTQPGPRSESNNAEKGMETGEATLSLENDEGQDIYGQKEVADQDGGGSVVEYYRYNDNEQKPKIMDNINDINNAGNSSIETTKKIVVYDIQKSVQYLKLVNDFLLKHQSVSKEEEKKIKIKFDKYREKLREQLHKTVDSIEKYINDEDDINSRTQNNSITGNNDQEFFYGIIDKIMKLISSLEFDVFRMISKEIIACLVEINDKFFENK